MPSPEWVLSDSCLVSFIIIISIVTEGLMNECSWLSISVFSLYHPCPGPVVEWREDRVRCASKQRGRRGGECAPTDPHQRHRPHVVCPGSPPPRAVLLTFYALSDLTKRLSISKNLPDARGSGKMIRKTVWIQTLNKHNCTFVGMGFMPGDPWRPQAFSVLSC